MEKIGDIYYVNRQEASELLHIGDAALSVLENYDIDFPEPFKAWHHGQRGRIYYAREDVIRYGDLIRQRRRQVAQRRAGKTVI